MPLLISTNGRSLALGSLTLNEERKGHDVQQVLPFIELVLRVKLVEWATRKRRRSVLSWRDTPLHSLRIDWSSARSDIDT